MFYGQFGEDKYLSQFFHDDYIGVCVDVGAYDGVNFSNTYYFENKSWKCLCIEPVPVLFEKCNSIRKHTVNYCASNSNKEEAIFHVVTLNGDNLSAISSLELDKRLIESHKSMITNITDIKVSCKSLTTIFAETDFPKIIDFISINSQNTELAVLKGIDFNQYKINFLVIKNTFSEIMIESYLQARNFTKIHRIAVNDFYVNNDYLNFKIYDCFDIIHANYYSNEDSSMGNVTNIVKLLTKKYIQSNYKNDVIMSNKLFGDTAFGQIKQLYITIQNTINKHFFKFVIKENTLLDFDMILIKLRDNKV